METLRIRDKAKIIELTFSDDQLKAMNELKERGKSLSTPRRIELTEKIACVSLCCNCREIPKYKIEYKMSGITKNEFFCSRCKNSVFERIQSELEDSNALAEHWGMTKVDLIPPTVT